jgi:hypothetical protein
VERSLHLSCRLDKGARTLNIDLAIGCKNAKYYARSTRLARVLNIAEHSLKLIIRVEEIATTRAYHNAHIQALNLSNTLNGCE